MHSMHDGRFAPSPSGPLHLGNLRTALLAWLHARAAGGRFLLRIDDLDPDRSRPEHERSQLEDLARIGIDWDGEPMRQTERLERYADVLAQLDAAGATYPCFCSRAEVRAASTAPHGSGPDAPYPGTCATLAMADAMRRIAAGDPHCIRVRADGASIGFDDELLGRVEAVVDDFVVRRRDGVPAYNVASPIDEADLGIEVVVRGADLAPTTPRQLWIAERAELAVPRFLHVPLVVGPDGERLAKRHGATSLDELGAVGIGPARVVALLGESLGLTPAGPVAGAADLLESFDLARLPRTPVTIDIETDSVDGSTDLPRS
jgi:glutamyl-tRNA synthetase